MIATALLLYALAVTDAAFCGFRAAIGRDGRIRKFAYYRRAVRRGAALGHLAVAVAVAVAAAILSMTPEPSQSWQHLLRAAGDLVAAYGLYATTVFLAFVPYAFGSVEARTLATVSILGPLTLVRPWVVVGAAILAVAHDPRTVTSLCVAVAVGAQLAIEPLLMRRYAARFASGDVLDPDA